MATETIPVQAHQPFVSPISVLERLDTALGVEGNIKNGKEEVAQVVSLMKESQMLVSRCVILNVIKATTSQPTLTRFMDAGGWPMLNMWLVEAKKAQNIALIVELLQVLQKLPVTVGSLKQGTMGKLIKQLSKQDNQEVKTLAGDLLNSWMAIFREGQSAKSSTKNGSTNTDPTSEERKNSTSGEDGRKTDKNTSLPDPKKDKKSVSKKKSSKKDPGPPIEAQPPPGPLVALGKPRDKSIKRPRDILLQKSQVPPEKKPKSSPSIANDNSSKTGKGFMESLGFMNALSSQVEAERLRSKEKKAKKVNKTTKLTRTNSNGGNDSSSATETKVEPDTPTQVEPEQEQKEDEPMEVPTEAQRLKKRVSWPEDVNLVSIHYFDLDESERVNVNRPKSFLDAAQREKMREREARESGLMFSRDRLIEMIPWVRPSRIEITDDLVEKGTASEQRSIQATREGTVLAQLFLSKASLPSTPTEPDPEPDMVETEPKLIPLMEPNAPGGGASGGSQPPMFSSPPATMVPPGHRPAESPLQSPGANVHPPQSHINYFNEGNNSNLHQFNHQMVGPTTGPPPPRGPPQNQPMPGGEANYMQYQQGFPPQPGEPLGQWGQQGPPPPGGNFYGDQFFPGRGGPPLRRGRGLGMRGRGRGFGFGSWRGRGSSLEARICKHFITHGCKLGSNCKFLHCTPEELANKMANNADPVIRNGPRSGTGPAREFDYPSPSRQTERMDTSNASSGSRLTD